MRYPFPALLTLLFVACMNSMAHADHLWPRFGGPDGDFRLPSIDFNWQQSSPSITWQRTLGGGMSGVVIDGDVAYVTFLMPFTDDETEQPESNRKHREVIAAIDVTSGETRWQHEYDSGWLEQQQAFGGRSRAPQATPAICGGRILTIGFTGWMHALDRNTGRPLWKKNLVEQFDAVPVQFGFSASPVPVDKHRVILLAGGASGGLVCLDARDGKTIWHQPSGEASYATPVVWQRPDGDQVVFVTRNRVMGVALDDGQLLWDVRLSEAGLTNVPTPLLIDDTDLLVSGQGVKGTRRLHVARGPAGYDASEVWHSQEQFFYCNWVQWQGKVIGCAGNLLVALDLDSGQTVGKHRGYRDANVILVGNDLLVLHGDGHLTAMELQEHEMHVTKQFVLFDERCWTPPTLAGTRMVCRGGEDFTCLDFGSDGKAATLAEVRIRKPRLALQRGPITNENDVVADRKPFEAIVAAYEQQGVDAAWRLYQQLRERDAESLGFAQRRQLAELARAEGLADVAAQVIKDATDDFPDMARQFKAALQPSNKTTQGDNGLTYLQFSIRNRSTRTIQAFVKGPKQHPFSYGLPLRPGIPRLENWPVGTTLYLNENGDRREVLLRVQKEFAGRVIDVPRPSDGARQHRS